MPSDIDIGWAAGFFDGEGSTVVSKTRGHRYVRLTISQKDREVLDRFCGIVGTGTVGRRRGSPVTIAPDGVVRLRPIFSWQTNSDPEARRVLAMIYPHLGRLKREQADRAIAASTYRGGHTEIFNRAHDGHDVTMTGGRKPQRHCRTCFNIWRREWRRSARLPADYLAQGNENPR